jgi:hypothetical protein
LLFWLLLLVRKDLLYPSDPPIFQSHLDAARVVGGRRQDNLHNPDRSVAGSLVLFLDNCDALTGTNVAAILAVHTGPDTLLSEPADIGVLDGFLGNSRHAKVTHRQV